MPLVVPQWALAAPGTLFEPNGFALKLSCHPIPITQSHHVIPHEHIDPCQLQKSAAKAIQTFCVMLSHRDPSCTGEVPPSEEFVAGCMAGGYG